MPKVVRNILAVLAGVIVAFGLVAVIESLGHTMYPVPPDLDFRNPEQVNAYVQSLPVGALLFVVTGWVAGTFAGAVAAVLVARRRPLLFSSIIGGVMLAATVANLILIPHPTWMAIAGISGIVAAAFAAGHFMMSRGVPVAP